MRQGTAGTDAQTLAFYGKEASAYAARSDKIGPSKQLTSFIARLPHGASVLDLGCGTGRDTQALIEAGLDVTPLDGSPEMAAQAEKRIGKPVRISHFEQLSDVETFDGIWANASLLHVPRTGLADILSRVHRALKPNGVLFASFKSGGTEGRDTLGRYYNYLTKDELEAFLAAAGKWASVELTEARGSGYDNVETGFVSCFARRVP